MKSFLAIMVGLALFEIGANVWATSGESFAQAFGGLLVMSSSVVWFGMLIDGGRRGWH